MENPTSESTVEPTEIKKDKLSETMESPTATANIENTPVHEANTTISHRPDSSIPTQETGNVVENMVENVVENEVENVENEVENAVENEVENAVENEVENVENEVENAVENEVENVENEVENVENEVENVENEVKNAVENEVENVVENIENVENVEQDNNESTELQSPSTQPIINNETINNEENSPDHPTNEDNSSPTKIPDNSESNENTTTPLPPIIIDTVPEKDNNPNLNSASSTGEAIASAWSSVSNYLWSWFEPPPEENQGENSNANVNNNNNTQSQPTSAEPQSGAGYYANLFSSFFTRTPSDNLNTQTMEKSSSLSSSRLNLLSQQARMSKVQFLGLEDDDEEDSVKPIVDHELSDYIRPHLPLYQRESVKWVLRYSTARHGISLNTLYQKVEKAGPLLVAIRDTENNVFGAYVSEPFHVAKGFYGTRECFLWKYLKGSLKMYPTSGNNEYFIHSEPDFIAIGAGNGNYGLYIDEDIQNGQSDECTAFFNEPLSSSVHFQILTLEVWSFEM